jgi:hypothetical protein
LAITEASALRNAGFQKFRVLAKIYGMPELYRNSGNSGFRFRRSSGHLYTAKAIAIAREHGSAMNTQGQGFL